MSGEKDAISLVNSIRVVVGQGIDSHIAQYHCSPNNNPPPTEKSCGDLQSLVKNTEAYMAQIMEEFAKLLKDWKPPAPSDEDKLVEIIEDTRNQNISNKELAQIIVKEGFRRESK